MKDLILIGAHCPDVERETFMAKLVNQLQGARDKYDILICSHLTIPEYISRQVDFVFYDRNNDLLHDMKYMNQPWFSPNEEILILSTLIGESSTYLAVYRLIVSGLGIAKIYGYKKVHYVEYDTDFQDLSELDVHSKLLDDYDWVAITKEEKNYEENIDWPLGNFSSFKLESVDKTFLEFDREKLLEILYNSPNKTNEKITYDVMTMNGNKIYLRDYYQEISQKNIYGLSRKTSRESLTYWAVPFYDTKKDTLCVVVWNNRDDGPIDVDFIINSEKVIHFDKIDKFGWSLQEVGKLENINSITTLVNGKIKNNLKFNEDSKELFKQTNYTIYK